MRHILAAFFLLASVTLQAQAPKPRVNGWHLMDPQGDGYLGISLEKAYSLLKGRKSTTVVVAVMDSGIDTLHEDLRSVLWRNPKELPGNGVDDDKNGYVDDVYGWNFCGAPSGENMAKNSHEVTRVYHTWKKDFEGRPEKSIPADKRFLFSQWTKASAIINKDYEEALQWKEGISNMMSGLKGAAEVLTTQVGRKTFKSGEIRNYAGSSQPSIQRAAQIWLNVFSRSTDTTATNESVLLELQQFNDQLQGKIDRKVQAPEDFRARLIGDRYPDITDRFYGNNNLKAGSGDHGTSVAGIIAAVRNNNVGIDGIADNVRIMAIRVMPGGDEYDKDVALGIRYAVDHGATIINMSFGKPVSPYKGQVDEAIKYAESKGVLLVHAAGNDGKDITTDHFYPNAMLLNGTSVTNFINVGASGDRSLGSIAAPFSNYSAKNVDIFAPGMHIYATATDNRYRGGDGTSLASPVVAGVAALLKSYFPSLTPAQLISILTTTGTPVNESITAPGEGGKSVPFSKLSSSGKIVNAYEAVKLALEKERKATRG